MTVTNRPHDYKHIAAWCRANQFSEEARLALQRFAWVTDAPIDALYFTPYTKSWVTMGSCGGMTRRTIEIQLNKGARA